MPSRIQRFLGRFSQINYLIVKVGWVAAKRKPTIPLKGKPTRLQKINQGCRQ